MVVVVWGVGKYLKVRQYKICVEYPAGSVGNVKVKYENEFDVL